MSKVDDWHGHFGERRVSLHAISKVVVDSARAVGAKLIDCNSIGIHAASSAQHHQVVRA